jgi:hypothetical protein
MGRGVSSAKRQRAQTLRYQGDERMKKDPVLLYITSI